MKNGLPNKKEWDNITQEAFSNLREHRFSERYMQKKDDIKRCVVMKNSYNRPEKLFIGLTAAAVAAAVAIPTAAVMLNKDAAPKKDAPTVMASAESSENVSSEENPAGIPVEPTEAATTYTEEGGRIIMPAELMKTFAIGETVSSYNELSPDITLDKAWLQDDFDGITTDAVGNEKDYSSYLHDGKLAAAGHAVYYKINDDGTSEKISERDYDAKILVAELTYTNPTDTEREYCISQNFWNLSKSGKEIMSLGVNFSVKTDADLDLLENREGHFSFYSENHSFSSEIKLAPGESTKVKLAFFVDEPELEDLYLKVATDGTNLYCYDLSDIK